MTKREKTLTVVSVSIAILFFGLAVALCVVSDENKKYQAILDVACDYSGNASNCKQGIKMLKGMSIKDIENFNPYILY